MYIAVSSLLGPSYSFGMDQDAGSSRAWKDVFILMLYTNVDNKYYIIIVQILSSFARQGSNSASSVIAIGEDLEEYPRFQFSLCL